MHTDQSMKCLRRSSNSTLIATHTTNSNPNSVKICSQIDLVNLQGMSCFLTWAWFQESQMEQADGKLMNQKEDRAILC